MGKKLLKYGLLIGLIIGFACSNFSWASSVGIELMPTIQTVQPGDSLDIEVYFVDYDPLADKDYYAGSDITLTFDATILAFNSWAPGPGMMPWSPLTSPQMQEIAPYTGNLLPGATGLLLATVNYTAINLGMSQVSVAGAPLFLSTADGEKAPGMILDNAKFILTGAQVNVVPLPGALWLLGCGLISLVFIRKKE
jgi:hypothetical protein